MLSNTEDEGIVERYVGTLRLSHVQIVPLGVRSWVQR